jgi:hypothetical protein
MAIADLDPDFWRFGMTPFSLGAVSPWLATTEYEKFGRSVDRVQGLDHDHRRLPHAGPRGPVH